MEEDLERKEPKPQFGREVEEERLCRHFSQCALNAPLFPKSKLELALRMMTRMFYERKRCEVSKNNCFFHQNTDATENSGASTDFKRYAALLTLVLLREERSARSSMQHLRTS